jgi:hypothetical protein
MKGFFYFEEHGGYLVFIYVKIVMRILIFRTNFMGIKNDLPTKNIYVFYIIKKNPTLIKCI